jgi:hypothetical protein
VLAVIALVDVFAVWVDVDRYDLLDRIVNHGNFTVDEADRSDSRNAAVGVLQLTLLALGAVGFVLWFVRGFLRSGARSRSRTTSGVAAIPTVPSAHRTRTNRSHASSRLRGSVGFSPTG